MISSRPKKTERMRSANGCRRFRLTSSSRSKIIRLRCATISGCSIRWTASVNTVCWFPRLRDPIRKAALIADMVQSIAQIPDPIQRSVYIKECARIMDIDENILISEVARKRMATTGDREADEFVRRQTRCGRRRLRSPRWNS